VKPCAALRCFTERPLRCQPVATGNKWPWPEVILMCSNTPHTAFSNLVSSPVLPGVHRVKCFV
jgi:hypothetical protein